MCSYYVFLTGVANTRMDFVCFLRTDCLPGNRQGLAHLRAHTSLPPADSISHEGEKKEDLIDKTQSISITEYDGDDDSEVYYAIVCI